MAQSGPDQEARKARPRSEPIRQGDCRHRDGRGAGRRSNAEAAGQLGAPPNNWERAGNPPRPGQVTVQLSFPNRTRSFDSTRVGVRFWAHYSEMEVSFFISADALKQIQPSLRCDENGIVSAFDANRSAIEDAAAKNLRSRAKRLLRTWADRLLNVHNSCLFVVGCRPCGQSGGGRVAGVRARQQRRPSAPSFEEEDA